MDLQLLLGLIAAGLAAGLIGALLGLGGGIFLVPLLTLVLNLPFQTAAGISLVAVAATSAAGSSTYVRTRLTNIRLAILLGVATVGAAIFASYLAQVLSGSVLRLLFGLLLLYAAFNMVRPQPGLPLEAITPDPARSDVWNLSSSYTDAALGRTISYQPERVPVGLVASLFGGLVSGLLGVGGGIVQVPVMHLIMRVPLKVATGTSSFLIGITAAASALVYYANGRIEPLYAAPIALSVFAGARLGAFLVQRLNSVVLKRIFALVAVFVALQMLLQALEMCPWCAPTR